MNFSDLKPGDVVKISGTVLYDLLKSWPEDAEIHINTDSPLIATLIAVDGNSALTAHGFGVSLCLNEGSLEVIGYDPFWNKLITAEASNFLRSDEVDQ